MDRNRSETVSRSPNALSKTAGCIGPSRLGRVYPRARIYITNLYAACQQRGYLRGYIARGVSHADTAQPGRRPDRAHWMIESMKLLDSTLTSTVAMLTGLSPERIEELGGNGDWEG